MYAYVGKYDRALQAVENERSNITFLSLMMLLLIFFCNFWSCLVCNTIAWLFCTNRLLVFSSSQYWTSMIVCNVSILSIYSWYHYISLPSPEESSYSIAEQNIKYTKNNKTQTWNELLQHNIISCLHLSLVDCINFTILNMDNRYNYMLCIVR